MFKEDSESDEEGILMKAHCRIAEKTEKGLDPLEQSFASETGNDTISLTQHSTDISLVETSGRIVNLPESDSFEFSQSELNTTGRRRSARIKRTSTAITSNCDDGLITSGRGRGRGRARGRGRSRGGRAMLSESSNEGKRTKRERKNNNLDVISIGSDDDADYASYAVPSKSKRKAKTGSKLKKNNTEPIETVSLPSDDETTKDDYLDDIMNVKIKWMCEGGLLIPHGRTEPFAKLYQKISTMKGYEVNKIVLCREDGRVVKPHETPLSIKFGIVDILEGSVSTEVYSEDKNSENPDAESVNSNENLLNFKILVEGQKAPTFVKIEKDQTMHVLLTKLAALLNSNADKMRLWFDGELIKLTDTPVILELEGDECLELKFKK